MISRSAIWAWILFATHVLGKASDDSHHVYAQNLSSAPARTQHGAPSPLSTPGSLSQTDHVQEPETSSPRTRPQQDERADQKQMEQNASAQTQEQLAGAPVEMVHLVRSQKPDISQSREMQSQLTGYEESMAGHNPLDANARNKTAFAVGSVATEAEAAARLRNAKILGLFVCLALLPVLIWQGLWAFLSVSMLLASLTTVQVAMRAALHDGLPFPYTLTGLHMLLTVATSLLAGPPREGELKIAYKTLPASLAGGAAVMLSNVALTQASVSFVTMMGSCTPVVTYLLEISLGMRAATFPSAVPVVMAFVGGALCVQGEQTFSFPALAMVLMGCCSRSLKSVFQISLLNADGNGQVLGPARLAAWGGFWTMILIAPAVILREGLGFFRALPNASSSSHIAALISCVSAVTLNLSQWSSLQYLGPVMQHMFGNLQLVFVLILASVWLHEDCTTMQWAGTLILVAGVVVAKMLFTAENKEPPKTAMPAPPATPISSQSPLRANGPNYNTVPSQRSSV